LSHGFCRYAVKLLQEDHRSFRPQVVFHPPSPRWVGEE
jgi:hypothetical protein